MNGIRKDFHLKLLYHNDELFKNNNKTLCQLLTFMYFLKIKKKTQKIITDETQRLAKINHCLFIMKN